MKQIPMFSRLTLEEAIELTVDWLMTYGHDYHHWVIAFSGGKDSSTVLSLLVHLIEVGKIPAPETLTALMSNTRQEFPPIYLGALEMLQVVAQRGVTTQVVEPALDFRFFTYMFGRGVPPSTNKFRWCTRLLKADPMNEEVAALASQAGGSVLVLTGVRQGESAVRDQKISLSCAKDGGECGQGWFQNAGKDGVSATLAPLLHWRLCHIEDWLTLYAPHYGFPTEAIVAVYGFDEDEEMNIRTGCAGCPLVQEDKALKRIISLPEWAYLKPLERLKPLYEELHHPRYRLRKWGERKKDGTLAAKQGRLGPLTMEARRWGLGQVLAIQDEINAAAHCLGRPEMWLITAEEQARIEHLIAANTWPDKWDGAEPRGDKLMARVIAEGVTQPLLVVDE